MLAVPREVDTERLGALVWYTIRQITRPTLDEIKRALMATGLPTDLTPKSIAPSDALRRTVKDLCTLPEREDGQGHVVRLLLREAPGKEKEWLRYHLVRETGDKARVELNYCEVGELELHKPSGRLTITPYTGAAGSGTADTSEREVLNQASALYGFNREHYDSEMVRYIIGKALKGTDPVTVRPSGGVFFIGRDHLGRVRDVADFLGFFEGDSRLYSVPVVNDADARIMVGDSVEAQVGAEAERVVADLKGLLESGKATDVSTHAALRSLRTLAEMTERYEELLRTRIDGARASLEAAQAQARSLLEAM